ncbi:response regulator [Massilia sp. Mn16-1_5]|uniref:hybrid sensor histidine kinase/response regulator n=1 Tax=Massilia sp. Mn16-1_5 TaxID=2079199 RepID=UPI00109E80A4|nr:response regulator [Massilia sp. Mn16-1_5]THC44232.1 hybrid sensor histidine kinase/response regulator [Massilia sp. Mn16-1_5]
MRTRTRFLLLVLSILVPSFIAATLAVVYVYRDAQQAQNRSMAETARAMALLVDNELETRQTLLRALAGAPSLERGDLPEFYEHAQRAAPPPASVVVLFDPDGRQLLNTRRAYGAELPQRGASNISELMKRYGAERTLVSDLFLAQVGKRHDFAIQVPVKLEGQVRYLLSLGLNASTLQRLLDRQQLPQGWMATIVDRNGIVVARSRTPELFIGKPIRPQTRARLVTSRDTMFESTSLDGIESRVFASTVPSADWKVLLSIPDNELRAAPLRAAALLGGLMALLLIAGLVAARRFAARAIAPIEALGQNAKALGEGAEVPYVPVGWTELDSVARHLAEASTRIRHGQTEMEARVAAAIAATERAQSALLKNQKLEALGRLTGGIAHEYNNLLQTLTTALQLAAFSTREEKVKGLLQTCQRTVARATALTGQLGSFGRLQEARVTTVDICEQLRNAVQLMKGSLRSDVAVEVHCEQDVWPVTVEPLQFDVALLNLALNARDAMPQGGLLRLEAKNVEIDSTHDTLARGDYVLVSMVDSGSGMTASVMARALDPFFTTKPPGQGTGLGLPQAYAFATQAGGTLILDSIPGIGTRVDLYLARARDEVAAAPQIDAGATLAHGSGTVLFVEDDALVREAVVRALQESGFEVLVAEDGEAALRLLETQGRRPDVVFSDIVMPGLVSGIDLAGILRQRYPGLPVVLATGYTEQQIDLPGVQVLAKPYAIEQLVATLSKTIAQG